MTDAGSRLPSPTRQALDGTEGAPGAGAAACDGVGRDRDQMVRQLLEEARDALGITRKDLAEKLGKTPRTLRNWLRHPAGLNAQQVEQLGNALEMSAESQAVLYVLTGQLPPSTVTGRHTGGSLGGHAGEDASGQLTATMALYRRMIDGLAHPSVVYDLAWNVVLTNSPFRAVFGGVRRHLTAHPTRNTQRYILFHPDAPEILGGNDLEAFHEFWLMPSLAVVSATLQRHPTDPQVREIERDIQRHPRTRRAYRETPRWIAQNGDITISPIPRPLWDPRSGKMIRAHVITEAHGGLQGATLQRATFICEEEPACRGPWPAG
ncbi:helix-turn-helix domain-containing protein [Streptomyces sp. NPDC052496]|uniref:MmyB family transcriptional regulator n=1 Tax=Streptomyces sp. NPDC052496 TaxID=3154951 RepID=UPI00342C8355